MTKIDLSKAKPTLPQLLKLAAEGNVILETLDGRQFVLAQIDDFAEEVAAVVKNRALMELLAERSKEKTTLPLTEARRRLNGKKKSPRKPGQVT